MIAEVVSIGDEITSGQRLDTNSQWLSQQLGECGIRAAYHTTVGDDLAANVRVFREAIQRADIVISTGGLGPTADDLTREALAETTGRPLRLDSTALSQIRALFTRRKREMPERNAVQAMFPETSRVIPNLNGTAPGIDLSVARPDRSPSRIFALPGVPAEMREMWKHSVAPAIAEMLGPSRHVIRHHCIKCFGVGESELERMLPDMIRRGRIPTVGITASKATLTLRVSAEAASDEAFHTLCAPTVKTIRELLGSLIFSEDDREELQHVVVRLLAQQHKSLATVEFGSGGLLSQWLTDADTNGRVYRGGIVLPTGTAVLSNPNQVPAATTNLRRTYFPPGTDEASATGEYAETARSLLDADYALVIGSFPQSDSADQKPGNVYLGLASPHGCKVHCHPFAGHPELLRERTLKLALNALRLELESADIAPPR